MDTKTIRWMRRDDMRRVVSIRRRCGMDSDLLDRVLRDPFGICKVAEMDGKIVGFLAYKNGRSRTRVLEVSVHPAFRRRGVALFLLNSMSAKMNFNLKRVEATVSEYNLPAQMLLKKAGFHATEVVSSPSGSDYAFVMRTAEKDPDSSAKSAKVLEN